MSGPEPDLDATAEITRDLIRIDSTNWGSGRSNGEAEAAAYVGAKLRDLGLEPQTFESAPGRASVVARVAGADADRPALVVHGHLDVVPADPANWSVDPFGGEIRDGMLWGRGAVDMKDMDAMMLTALGDILGAGERPARDLVIAFFADEENGGEYGSQFMVAEHPELFAGADEAISEVGGFSIDVEGTRAYLLQVGEKTLSWIRLVARGTASHGSRVSRDNAIVHLAAALERIGTREWPLEWTATTRRMVADLEDLLGASGSDPAELIRRTGTGAGFLSSTLRVTSNPTGLTAGYKHNVVPDRAEALIDIRTLPGDQERVLAEIAELAGEHIEIETVTSDIGLENPFQGPLVESMIAALQRHDPGAPVLPYLLGGGTDNKALSRLGIRGYGFAPLRLGPELDFPGMFHGVDERVPLDALVFGRAVLGDFLRHC